MVTAVSHCRQYAYIAWPKTLLSECSESGSSCPMSCLHTTTLAKAYHPSWLQLLCQALTGVPAALQRLHWAGRQLRDDQQSLDDAGLGEDDLLQLTLPLWGGAPVTVGLTHTALMHVTIQCLATYIAGSSLREKRVYMVCSWQQPARDSISNSRARFKLGLLVSMSHGMACHAQVSVAHMVSHGNESFSAAHVQTVCTAGTRCAAENDAICATDPGVALTFMVTSTASKACGSHRTHTIPSIASALTL